MTAAAAVPDRTVELRYERLVVDPRGAAEPVAERLGVAVEPVADRSCGRARSLGRALARDLSAEQLADVEDEAGEALVRLGYELSGRR